MLSAAIRAGEQRILAVQGQRADRTFNHIGIDLNPAVVEEQGQARPAGQRVTDRLGELALLADKSELLAQPRLKSLDERPAAVLAHSATLLGRAAADLALDPVEGRDAGERFRRDRRRSAGEFIELPP